MAAKKKLSIEENISQLEELIETLEQEDTSLEDSITAYTKGVKLVKECENILDDVEKKIIILSESEENQEA